MISVEFIIAMGIPAAICSGAIGFAIWWLKRYIDRRDQEHDEKNKNTEKLMLMIMQTSRATNVLAEATARAVQRIPDAHCNGDMTSALERAAAIQKEEQQFMFDQAIKHIFDD